MMMQEIQEMQQTQEIQEIQGMQERQIRILLLEEKLADAELLMRTLLQTDLEHELHWVETKKHFLSELDNFKPDVILSERTLSGFKEMEALQISRKYSPDIPFILVTGSDAEGL